MWRHMAIAIANRYLNEAFGKQAEDGQGDQGDDDELEDSTPIVQIMGTGGGKSLSFILPAYYSADGVTVVVTPLVALWTDMHARCVKAGITSHVWQSQKNNQAASIVFVTLESAVTKGFRDFVARLEARQALDRVVVDECHVVLEGTRTFRPQLRELGVRVSEFGVQLVCLTATLTPSDEAAFLGVMGIDSGRARIFRAASTKRNIRYKVVIPQKAEEGEGDIVAEEVYRIVEEWASSNGKEKAVVYATSIEQVERLGALLGCPVFYSDVDTARGKAERLEAWRRGNGADGGIVVATNALGLGIDIPDVRLVVHAGMPRELRRFV
ncbi:DNA helicase [Colletotrichum musicola]|uniref:DNA 3'-5' helicase n=1 Tax=Colletotrichum musicola TaxID=2175873 RepID=A0A8H6JMD1_9PEZI|nr:DNA helicase [Colletotrichum musicola]